jgi:hypothetical protein
MPFVNVRTLVGFDVWRSTRNRCHGGRFFTPRLLFYFTALAAAPRTALANVLRADAL